MTTNWQQWVTTLGKYDGGDLSLNPYAFDSAESNAPRRHNLQRYLTQMQQRQPTLLLVGEALGYRGGRVTGIPFVSAHILETHPQFANTDYMRGSAAHAHKEATSSMMWQTLDTLNCSPLLWNAYPFHPHKLNQPNSNRAPKKHELAIGSEILQSLLAQFQLTTIVAVGNRAHASLNGMGLDCTKVRHPSHGGKTQFAAGLKAIVSR